MISIEIPGFDEVVGTLRAFPGAAKASITEAIRRALISGRQVMIDEVKSRYAAPTTWIRGAVGNPNITGLQGRLRVSGSRIPAYLFPNTRDVYPSGVKFQQMTQGEMTSLMHAFIPGHPKGQRKAWFFQRWGHEHDASIHPVMGPALAEMVGNKNVEPKVEARILEMYERRLWQNIDAFLNGSIAMRNGRMTRVNIPQG